MPSQFATPADPDRIACVKAGARGQHAEKQARALLAEGLPCKVRGGQVIALAEDVAAWVRGDFAKPASNQPNWGAINARTKPKNQAG